MDQTLTILLMRGDDPDGNPIFAYVGFLADKVAEFMEAQKAGNFRPEDYGVVIESGEGDPSEEVRQKMETECGFKHEAMTEY